MQVKKKQRETGWREKIQLEEGTVRTPTICHETRDEESQRREEEREKNRKLSFNLISRLYSRAEARKERAESKS